MSQEPPRLFDGVDRRDDPHGRPRHEWRIAEGRRRRDEGVKHAEGGTIAIARRAGERALADLASSGREFTSDDLHDLLEERGAPTLPSAHVGACFRKASQAGLIVSVGARRSTRPSRNRGLVMVWKGAA